MNELANVSFTTLFLRTRNVQLSKETGQIPAFMHLLFGCRATIVTHREDEYPDAASEELKGVSLCCIRRLIAPFSINLSALLYLLRRSRSIDILHLTHVTRESIACALLYKFLNRRGTVFIKLDLDYKNFPGWEAGFSKNPLVKWIARGFLAKGFDCMDLVAIESQSGASALLTKYPKLKEKLVVVHNGVNHRHILKQVSSIKPFEQRENLIIIAGTVGNYQKNTELLLAAVKLIEWKDNWRICCLGRIEQGFENKITDFFGENPGCKGKIEFIGLQNRETVYGYFNRAKILCLSSRYEGFPHVFSEALFFGLFIVTTDVSNAEEVTANGCGEIVPQADPAALAKALQRQMDTINANPQRFSAIRESGSKFTWEESAGKLGGVLIQRIKRKKTKY